MSFFPYKTDKDFGVSSRVNEPKIELRIQIHYGWYATLFSVYVPTLRTDEETAITFYETLCVVIISTPNDDKFIILGDFNACVSRDFEIWNVLSRYSIGWANANCLKPLEICSKLNLTICNSLYRQKLKIKNDFIEFIITHRRNICDVYNERIIRKAKWDTNHNLVRRKFAKRIEWKSQKISMLIN